MVNNDTLQSGNSGLLAATGVDFRSGRMVEGLPLVTIGVLSYNYSRYIREALDSLLRQTYPNIELIIVDDCSTEEATRPIIRQWISNNKIHCTYIENGTNLGITAVSNMIVRRASGKYLDLFATDDIMLPEKIERQVQLLESAGEDYGMCYANALKMDDDGVMQGEYQPGMQVYEGDVLADYVYRRLIFVTPSALIRRSVYAKAGMYDERVIFEDYNFWLRLMACFKVKYCDYPCLIYREKSASPVYDLVRNNNQERYFRDRVLSNLQALDYIRVKTIRQHLIKKTEQYLKSLAVHNAGSLDELLPFLLRNGSVYLALKTWLLRAYCSLRNQ